MKFMFWAVACFLLILAPPAMAAGDPAAGQQKSAVCSACHGVDGNSVVPQWPKIAGQHAAYLERHITLIRDGARPVPEMMGIAAGLSDQGIEDLSAFYASQPRQSGVADPALAPAGEALYRAGNADEGIPACMACHGPAGLGNPLTGFPALAGQHALYTANMLKKYRSGTQWGAEDANSKMMVGVARYLTDAEIEAVASYIQGLHRAEAE